MMAVVTPRLPGEITLVDRLSEARASAQVTFLPPQLPPPQQQTDFLPAHLTNSASVSGEPGAASANSTSNSSIEVDNSIGTLRVPGDGTASAGACVNGNYAEASAKVIVLTFTLTDRSYTYSLSGQLGGDGFIGGTATARLTAGSSAIFQATTSTTATLSETGTLSPGTYKLSVDMTASANPDSIGGGCTGRGSRANFNFALDQAPPPTPTPTAPATPTATPTPTVTPNPTATPTPTPGEVTQAVNLSTRLLVGTGNNVGIGGFIITGSDPKQVLLRGIGPSLAGAGIANPLADPVLELHGPGSFTTITNNNWRETQEAEITATGIPPHGDLEPAILVTLDPGSYTAILRGNGGTSGVALVEIYSLGASASKLANVSTRASVRTGNDIVIAGFILSAGSSNPRIIVRGIGPSLESLGLSPVLANPSLELRDSNGALLISNNDWQDTAIEPAVLGTGLEPTNDLESAVGGTLPPGAYTALLTGVNGGTGLGLVEVYDLGSQ